VVQKVVRCIPEDLRGRAWHSKPATTFAPFALGADRENVDPASPGTPVARHAPPRTFYPAGPTPGRAIPHSPHSVVAHARDAPLFFTTLEKRLAGNDAVLSAILAK